jgi:hypothetical protein
VDRLAADALDDPWQVGDRLLDADLLALFERLAEHAQKLKEQLIATDQAWKRMQREHIAA